MKYDLVINGIVIGDIDADREYSTAKELLIEKYMPRVAGKGRDIPDVFAQGDGQAVIVAWDQVATIEARLKSEDPRKAPDFDINRTIALGSIDQLEWGLDGCACGQMAQSRTDP